MKKITLVSRDEHNLKFYDTHGKLWEKSQIIKLINSKKAVFSVQSSGNVMQVVRQKGVSPFLRATKDEAQKNNVNEMKIAKHPAHKVTIAHKHQATKIHTHHVKHTTHNKINSIKLVAKEQNNLVFYDDRGRAWTKAQIVSLIESKTNIFYIGTPSNWIQPTYTSDGTTYLRAVQNDSELDNINQMKVSKRVHAKIHRRSRRLAKKTAAKHKRHLSKQAKVAKKHRKHLTKIAKKQERHLTVHKLVTSTHHKQVHAVHHNAVAVSRQHQKEAAKKAKAAKKHQKQLAKAAKKRQKQLAKAAQQQHKHQVVHHTIVSTSHSHTISHNAKAITRQRQKEAAKRAKIAKWHQKQLAKAAKKRQKQLAKAAKQHQKHLAVHKHGHVTNHAANVIRVVSAQNNTHKSAKFVEVLSKQGHVKSLSKQHNMIAISRQRQKEAAKKAKAAKKHQKQLAKAAKKHQKQLAKEAKWRYTQRTNVIVNQVPITWWRYVLFGAILPITIAVGIIIAAILWR